ncbi:hypothetical protein [Planotetraspora silvatica]|uniref:hypothetical protein n=1 Tax=Planotetraspora silvatica TaxID=234614 RepID=UPI00195243F7|nr:hypothetical protein [Planotetraspora silvatica]
MARVQDDGHGGSADGSVPAVAVTGTDCSPATASSRSSAGLRTARLGSAPLLLGTR